ncbi:MAG: hypothetical protein CSA73_00695 [Rhodobacterales bacterium]|nr:MAG: hypothetical protein CSA73_00695 [Rhodobacterales bacterium]
MSGTTALYRIFAENLRILTSDHRSVSELCRELGINRTQFNRYLSGQASPRPEVLQRICQYFGVDARVLLEPLERILGSGADPGGQARSIFEYLYRGRGLLTLRSPPPAGIHRYWQRSSLNKDWVNSYTIRLFQNNGTTMFRALEDSGRDGSPAILGRPGRDVRGWFMDQDDGIVMQACQPMAKRLSFAVLSYPVSSDNLIYPGTVMISRPSMRQVTRIEHCALELLPQGKALWPALRQRGGRWVDQLPEELRSVMTGKVS